MATKRRGQKGKAKQPRPTKPATKKKAKQAKRSPRVNRFLAKLIARRQRLSIGEPAEGRKPKAKKAPSKPTSPTTQLPTQRGTGRPKKRAGTGRVAPTPLLLARENALRMASVTQKDIADRLGQLRKPITITRQAVSLYVKGDVKTLTERGEAVCRMFCKLTGTSLGTMFPEWFTEAGTLRAAAVHDLPEGTSAEQVEEIAGRPPVASGGPLAGETGTEWTGKDGARVGVGEQAAPEGYDWGGLKPDDNEDARCVCGHSMAAHILREDAGCSHCSCEGYTPDPDDT